MNSISIEGKGNSIYGTKKYLEYNSRKYKPKPLKFKEVVLACGREVSVIRKEFVTNALNDQLPKVLARVAVDTSSMFRPMVKIDFSTQIEVRDFGIPTTEGIVLRFRLNKTCNGEPNTLKTYEFKRIFIPSAALTNETKDSFSFTFCDEESLCENGCCTYTVELYEVQIFAGPVERLVISDSAINAIAQELC